MKEGTVGSHSGQVVEIGPEINFQAMNQSLESDLLKEGVVEVLGDNGAFYKSYIIDVSESGPTLSGDGEYMLSIYAFAFSSLPF